MSAVLCVGIATLDRIFSVERHPPGPGKYRATSRTVTGGGVAANAAVTIARLGGQARFLGVVGDDPAGVEIVASLADEGVDVSGVRFVEGRMSPESIVTIDAAGDRTILNHASADLFDAATAVTPDEIGRPDVVLTDMRWRNGAVAALTTAADLGIPGVVDCDHDPVDAPGILEAASHALFGRATLMSWTSATEPEAGLRTAAARLDAWVGVTDGDRGTWWLDDGMLAHAPTPVVKAVDTLAAGDVFHGAFALAVAEGAEIRRAIDIASAAAALKCTRFGGRMGIPTRAELDRFLEERMERR